jgi:hypothetical protein
MTKNVRIDPLGLVESKGSSKVVVARVENTVVGVCPLCSVPMQTLEVADVQAYVCMEHCVCLPVEDNPATVPAVPYIGETAPVPAQAPHPYGYGLFSDTQK